MYTTDARGEAGLAAQNIASVVGGRTLEDAPGGRTRSVNPARAAETVGGGLLGGPRPRTAPGRAAPRPPPRRPPPAAGRAPPPPPARRSPSRRPSSAPPAPSSRPAGPRG